jgi:uncharacterized protein (TIGR02646 family)
MRKFTRAEEPEILRKNWQRYGERYALNRAANPSHLFRWPLVNGERLNQIILHILKLQTQHHCSYCDGFPLGPADETIDHFKPKSDERFYQEVCKWENLYVACADCQKVKANQYSDLLLKPDETDYHFNKYFVYDYQKHEINLRPGIDNISLERAKITLSIFRLNEPAFCKSRQISLERYKANAFRDPDDYGFRFMFD